MKLKVAHVTTCRSDYGPCYWLLKELFGNEKLQTILVVGGSHLKKSHGYTYSEILKHKWPRVHRIPFLVDGDRPEDLAESCSRALKSFGYFFRDEKPDILLLYGDRIELLPIATAATIHGIPIAHICGGDVTEGAIDDQVRHALTKLAHLHFPSTKSSAMRIRKMGEEPWRIIHSGDPALDHFKLSQHASRDELEASLGFQIHEPALLVTLHPETVFPQNNLALVDELLIVLEKWFGTIIITAPAPDPGGGTIRRKLQSFANRKRNVHFIESLGGYRYRSLLFYVSAVVGNSSSGLIEAAAVPVPTVNIGDRQKGRERGCNVIDARPNHKDIAKALVKSARTDFRNSLTRRKNPYGFGDASQIIVNKLLKIITSNQLLKKRFE